MISLLWYEMIIIFSNVNLCQVFLYLTGVESPSVVDTILKFSKSQNFTVLQIWEHTHQINFLYFYPKSHAYHAQKIFFTTYIHLYLNVQEVTWGKFSIILPLNYMRNMHSKCFTTCTTYLSELPDASKSSFGWYSTMLTGPLWYVKSVRILPAVISQI